MHENERHDNQNYQDTDEIDEVLATLRRLIDWVSSPVVRACLEDARDDIIHLIDKDVDSAEDADQLEVA